MSSQQDKNLSDEVSPSVEAEPSTSASATPSTAATEKRTADASDGDRPHTSSSAQGSDTEDESDEPVQARKTLTFALDEDVGHQLVDVLIFTNGVSKEVIGGGEACGSAGALYATRSLLLKWHREWKEKGGGAALADMQQRVEEKSPLVTGFFNFESERLTKRVEARCKPNTLTGKGPTAGLPLAMRMRHETIGTEMASTRKKLTPWNGWKRSTRKGLLL